MTTSVFDHGWLCGLFGDAEIAGAFGPDAQIERMLAVEAALTRALAAAEVIGADAAKAVLGSFESFVADHAAISGGTARDGVPVPEFVRQLRAHAGGARGETIHKGATSQDIVDTALVLTLGHVNGILGRRMMAAIEALDALIERFGARPLMGRTRMQAAVPITVADRILTWRDPLELHMHRLAEISPRLMVLQFGGAAGNRSALADKGNAVAEAMATVLNLSCPDKAWHAMRDRIVEYAGWLSLVTGTLGKMGQDVCLMAQDEIGEIRLSGGGSSSAMPHKRNPVMAELLVTLARFNAVQLSGMHQTLIHEQERSGAAWSLEWMLLPPMAEATGRALTVAREIADSVEAMGEG